jgi:hypothetical protein
MVAWQPCDRRRCDADQQVESRYGCAPPVGVVPIVGSADFTGLQADLGEFEHAGMIERDTGGESRVVGGDAEELAGLRASARSEHTRGERDDRVVRLDEVPNGMELLEWRSGYRCVRSHPKLASLLDRVKSAQIYIGDYS